MPLLVIGWNLRHSVFMCLLLHSPVLMMFCLHHAATSCSQQCYCSESDSGGKTVRCSNLRLTEIPQDLPNDTQRVYLDFNLLTEIHINAFQDLPLLSELDLSNNNLSKLEPGAFNGLGPSLTFLDLSNNNLSKLEPGAFSGLGPSLTFLNLSNSNLSRLEPGAFRGLGPSLTFLDLSSNKLVHFIPEAFEGLQTRANLTNNPWHCDCSLQRAIPHIQMETLSLTGIVCNTSDPSDERVVDKPFLLVKDLDLCMIAKTTDVAMLVIMFGWFSMVISYLVYYVRQNTEDARRHMQYLKSLPTKHGQSSLTISTAV